MALAGSRFPSLSVDLINNYIEIKKELEVQRKLDPVAASASQFQGKSSEQASKLLADKYFTFFYENSEIKNTRVGRNVQRLEKGFQQSVSYELGNKRQQLDFTLQPFSTVAQLDYKGFVEATYIYRTLLSEDEFQLKNKIFENKSLILIYSKNPYENRSAVNLMWTW